RRRPPEKNVVGSSTPPARPTAKTASPGTYEEQALPHNAGLFTFLTQQQDQFMQPATNSFSAPGLNPARLCLHAATGFTPLRKKKCSKHLTRPFVRIIFGCRPHPARAANPCFVR